MSKVVNIIGAGLAGSEAAYQLAKRNIKVNLYESKNVKANDVQKLSSFAELVCSNSLRSDDMSNAVGTLKEEMRMLDSLIIKAAQHAKVPAGGSLAVDRDMFSKYITDTLKSNALITIYEEEKTNIDPNEINLIATGPLTTEKFQTYLSELLGQDDFYFFDAVAPIIEKDSINFDIAFRKNRYEKGETQDYINCPMTKEQYDVFYNELIKGDIAISHLEEEKSLKYFEACMPVEAIAKRGENTLLFGPMKPQGLTAPNGVKPYAVVQLRQDNASDTLYNLVGFQTNLKWLEQERIFSLIPGLENIKIVRHGVMHKNNYLNSPKLLNNFLQLKSNPNIFFAGQITGVEGYVESTVTGLITAINIANFINNKEMTTPTSATVTGALLRYINVPSVDFQPMKANWGIVKSLDLQNPRITKVDKKKLYSTRAIKEMREYIISNNIGEAND